MPAWAMWAMRSVCKAVKDIADIYFKIEFFQSTVPRLNVTEKKLVLTTTIWLKDLQFVLPFAGTKTYYCFHILGSPSSSINL